MKAKLKIVGITLGVLYMCEVGLGLTVRGAVNAVAHRAYVGFAHAAAGK